MAREVKRLSARGVATISEPGRHADGAGLYLIVNKGGSKQWAFLFRWNGKAKELGLGGVNVVSLADARSRADEARRQVEAGINPIEARQAAKQKASATPTFGEMANAYVDDMAAGWRNAKHVAQWKATLGNIEADAKKLRIDAVAEKAHRTALAKLRALPVDKVDTDHVLAVLTPIWKEKPETASRLRGRLEAVLAAATAKGLRTGANPALWRNHLDRLLPRRQKLSRGHHAAMPYQDVAAFIGRLRQQEGLGALALEFTILTAARSGEVIGARRSEIDRVARLWTVPAERMKGGRVHRVPLCDRALEILDKVAKFWDQDEPGGFVFPGRRVGRPQSSMVLEMVMRRMEATDATPHGFRSSFRDWAGEYTNFPREVAEAALAHIVGDETERAYRRGDALDKRRNLMDEWARWALPKTP